MSNTPDDIWDDEQGVCPKHNLITTWAPDPYASEINDDYSDYLMCEKCRTESAWEI
jgi:hypothetical protein